MGTMVTRPKDSRHDIPSPVERRSNWHWRVLLPCALLGAASAMIMHFLNKW